MILVFGKTGQVASELQMLLPDAIFLDRSEANLLDPITCGTAIREMNPLAVINAAAYTAVDNAEKDEDHALLINGISPTIMAKNCAILNIPFIHISTEYVFDGSGDAPFAPNATKEPLNAYGRTKLVGELGVQRAASVHVILRTSWVFSSHGENFVKTMLRLSNTRNALEIVGDQFGGPTPARSIAKACVKIVTALKTNPELSGTYNFSGFPNVNWSSFAREIFLQSGCAVNVTDIPSSAYPTLAVRPLNSRMDCSTLRKLDLSQPDWRSELSIVLKELEVLK